MTNPRLPRFFLPILCAASPLLAQGEVELRVTAKKGGSIWLQQTQKQEQTIDMGGQQMETSQTTTRVVEVTIKDVDDKGNLTVETKIARIHGNMEMPQMGEMEFDSAAPAEEADDSGMAGMMSMMTKSMMVGAGKSFTAKVDSQGKVVELLDGAAELLKGGGNRMMGGSSIDEGTLKQIVQNAFGMLPEKPVAVGGKWAHTQSDTRGRGPIEHKLELTLAKADADLIEITATGTVAKPESKKEGKDEPEAGGDQAAAARQIMDSMKVSNGKVSGMQRISRQDGFVVETTSTVTMDVEASSPMGEMQMSVKTTSSTKRCTAEDAAPKKKAAPAKDEGKKEGAKEAGK